MGYERLSGPVAGQALAQLHSLVRLYVNFSQPSFKLVSKSRVGAKVTKRYDKPSTPCDRLLSFPGIVTRFDVRLNGSATALTRSISCIVSATPNLSWLRSLRQRRTSGSETTTWKHSSHNFLICGGRARSDRHTQNDHARRGIGGLAKTHLMVSGTKSCSGFRKYPIRPRSSCSRDCRSDTPAGSRQDSCARFKEESRIGVRSWRGN